MQYNSNKKNNYIIRMNNMKKPFKNRLTQESESFLNELKSKVIVAL